LILVGLINDIDGDFFLHMSKRAKVSIFTRVSISTISLAKFALVPTGVVELLNFIVRFMTSTAMFLA
jgi:hypothetical protein